MTWRTWGVYCWGFVAGAALASYVALTCAPAHGQSPEVAYALDHAADTYGVSRRCLWTIAERETGGTFWPWVTNPRSGAAGLMQYVWSTWRNLSRWAGYEGESPYDPWAAAHVAAWAISHPWESQGGIRHWRWC